MIHEPNMPKGLTTHLTVGAVHLKKKKVPKFFRMFRSDSSENLVCFWHISIGLSLKMNRFWFFWGPVILDQRWLSSLGWGESLLERLWSSCCLIPLHSLTGPVGQLFASHLGGQRFAPWGYTHTSGKGFFILVLSCYIGDPDVIPYHRPW
jgi:hypothetical protein